MPSKASPISGKIAQNNVVNGTPFQMWSNTPYEATKPQTQSGVSLALISLPPATSSVREPVIPKPGQYQ